MSHTVAPVGNPHVSSSMTMNLLSEGEGGTLEALGADPVWSMGME